MYLTTHSAAGILVGVLFPHPAAAFAGGVISHAVLDIIPHEPPEDLIVTYPRDRKHSGDTVRRRIQASRVDIIGVLVLIALSWIFSQGALEESKVLTGMLAGIAGGVVPDGIIVLVFFMDNRFLRWYFNVHCRTHFVFPNVHISRTFSAIYQALLACLLVISAYRLIQ